MVVVVVVRRVVVVVVAGTVYFTVAGALHIFVLGFDDGGEGLDGPFYIVRFWDFILRKKRRD